MRVSCKNIDARCSNIEGALQLLYRATQTSSEADGDPNAKEQEAAPVDESGQTIFHKTTRSLKLWSMLTDLEESFGTFNVCASVSLSLSLVW